MELSYYFSTQGCALGVSWVFLSCLPAPAAAAAFRALMSKKLAITALVVPYRPRSINDPICHGSTDERKGAGASMAGLVQMCCQWIAVQNPFTRQSSEDAFRYRPSKPYLLPKVPMRCKGTPPRATKVAYPSPVPSKYPGISRHSPLHHLVSNTNLRRKESLDKFPQRPPQTLNPEYAPIAGNEQLTAQMRCIIVHEST